MNKTSEHLKEAIKGEFNAAKRYLNFAEIASSENFPNVAYLFRALAMAEGIHLKNHQQALGEKFQPVQDEIKTGDTRNNLLRGVDGETWEFASMYPSFIKDIRKESKAEMAKLALLSMEWAKNVEGVHANLLTQALHNLETGKDAEITQIWICKVCGNIILNAKPETFCKVCKHDVMFFELVPR